MCIVLLTYFISGENPVIVDPRTGKLNSFGYLQHFPHMAQTFVSLIITSNDLEKIIVFILFCQC